MAHSQFHIHQKQQKMVNKMGARILHFPSTKTESSTWLQPLTILKMAAATLAPTMKPQILPNHIHILRNHIHQNQIARSQFPFSLITIYFHLQYRLHSPPLRRHPRLNMSSLASDVPPSDSSPPIKTVKVVIKGRVQGVFYRNWTIENATELGLKGWVRNRRDGSVEALFSGSVDKVGEMQERCRRGPPSAVVTGLDVFPSTEIPGTGFERRSTV